MNPIVTNRKTWVPVTPRHCGLGSHDMKQTFPICLVLRPVIRKHPHPQWPKQQFLLLWWTHCVHTGARSILWCSGRLPSLSRKSRYSGRHSAAGNSHHTSLGRILEGTHFREVSLPDHTVWQREIAPCFSSRGASVSFAELTYQRLSQL